MAISFETAGLELSYRGNQSSCPNWHHTFRRAARCKFTHSLKYLWLHFNSVVTGCIESNNKEKTLERIEEDNSLVSAPTTVNNRINMNPANNAEQLL